MSAEEEPGGTGSDANAPWLVSTWRTVQKADADAWRKLRDDAPFRLLRWLGALGVVIGTWVIQGTPHSAIAWLPVLGVVVLLVLPDASSIAFGGFTWQARQAADTAVAASEKAERLAVNVYVAAQTGEAAGESAQARDAAAQPADQALGRFLR